MITLELERRNRVGVNYTSFRRIFRWGFCLCVKLVTSPSLSARFRSLLFHATRMCTDPHLFSHVGVEVPVDDWIREPKNRREQYIGLHRRRQSDEETNQGGCEQNVWHPVWESEHVDPSGRPKEGLRSLDCGLRRFGRCEQDWHHLIISFDVNNFLVGGWVKKEFYV